MVSTRVKYIMVFLLLVALVDAKRKCRPKQSPGVKQSSSKTCSLGCIQNLKETSQLHSDEISSMTIDLQLVQTVLDEHEAMLLTLNDTLSDMAARLSAAETTEIETELDIDDCASSPCQNGAKCVDKVNGFACQCLAGFTGETCATDIDDCASPPCQNGAKCVDKVNGFTCQCLAGYTGETCATDIDDCASSPCQNGAKCVDKVNGFACQCLAGFTGQMCETKEGCTVGRDGWHDKACPADGNCGTANSECRKQKCLCAHGYFYSESSQCCLEECSSLTNGFTETSHTKVTTSVGLIGTKSYPTNCKTYCATLPNCVTTTSSGKTGDCRFYSVTPRTAGFTLEPDYWFTFYQRHCA